MLSPRCVFCLYPASRRSDILLSELGMREFHFKTKRQIPAARLFKYVCCPCRFPTQASASSTSRKAVEESVLWVDLYRSSPAGLQPVAQIKKTESLWLESKITDQAHDLKPFPHHPRQR